MPTLETLTEADLRGALEDQSLQRARGYLGRVQNPVRSGQSLSAQVRGSSLYQVEIEVLPGGIQARCSCPYDWGGLCKHIGAVLLTWIRDCRSFAVEGAAAASTTPTPIEIIPVELLPTARPKALPAWVTTSFAERQRQEQRQLLQWVEMSSLQNLRAMARERGWMVRGTRKSEVAQQVLEQMFAPRTIHQVALGLDEEHRQVLRALVVLFGEDKVPAEDLERAAGLWGELKRHKQATTYTRHLCEAGLALPGEVKGGYPPCSDFVPPVVARHLPPVLADVIPTSAELRAAGAVSGLSLADPDELVRSAHQIVTLLRQSAVPLRPPLNRPRLEKFYAQLTEWDYEPLELAELQQSQKLQPYADLYLTVPPPGRSLPDEAIKRLAPIANGEARLEFVYALLVGAGIFQAGSPVTVWEEVYTEFVRREAPVQRAILARTYFQMLNWSALWEVLRARQDLRLKRAWRYTYHKPPQLALSLCRFRQLVLRVLACLPNGRWVQLADLTPLLRAVFPRFDGIVWESARSADTLGAWYLARGGRPLQPGHPGDWDAAQGSFVRQMIAGPLHWLGLADLQFDGEALVALRLHGLADLYWDRVEVPQPPSHASDRASIVPPSSAVTTDAISVTVSPSAVSAHAHSLLDRMARLEVAEPGRFVYRLNAQAAYKAFEDGATLSELLDGWQRFLPVPMPDAIRAQLAEWWQAYGRVRVYKNLTVVEFGDDYALAEMKAVTSLAQHLVAEISPRLVIVRPEGVEALVTELEKAGYTPKQTDKV